ncbi:O-methylsterigmatocystin oxidoreductase [Stachybotrys elegans]|uniref:O-methylsterigmatocystin oxidoreductase n=1 Tax=Stachybotrys elegans TaxID=80388 RepID=A0A8K0T3P6_9HYPO|nr:O-methylsterigmatocystin oxidoreductase [Stachybotrys elegans]
MVFLSPTTLGAVALIGYFLYLQLNRRSPRLPPGPTRLPIVGNIRDLPPRETPEHLHWMKHKDLYGPITSVSVMGSTVVVVHDRDMAHELLEEMSSKTSDRPSMVMAGELCGYGKFTLMQHTGPRFRRARKYITQELTGLKTSSLLHDILEGAVKRHVVQTMRDPRKQIHHCKTAVTSTIMKLAYGYRAETDGPDSLNRISEQVMADFGRATAMAWPVDAIPALRHVPESFPGAGFKKTARQYNDMVEKAAYMPYNFVKRQVDSKSHKPSYVSKLLEKLRDQDGVVSEEDKEAIVWTAASLYGGGTDTSMIPLTVFTMAMAKWPHIQERVQDEIDRAVGTDRLPTFEDRRNLPYLNAVIAEVSRWWPAAPMGFPHAATEDIVFRGYDIPKGTIITPAVWWFLHNPEVYEKPDVFDPERFLAPRNEPDPAREVFGYGRRRCAGVYVAEEIMFLNVAQVVAAFRISQAMGSDGEPIPIDTQPKPGVLCYPPKFDFHIELRSEQHEALLKRMERELPQEAGDSNQLDSYANYTGSQA